jgi:hypothetical protein
MQRSRTGLIAVSVILAASRPGNCIPRDDWGPGGYAGGGTQHTCYTAGGSAIQYSGNMPDSRCR